MLLESNSWWQNGKYGVGGVTLARPPVGGAACKNTQFGHGQAQTKGCVIVGMHDVSRRREEHTRHHSVGPLQQNCTGSAAGQTQQGSAKACTGMGLRAGPRQRGSPQKCSGASRVSSSLINTCSALQHGEDIGRRHSPGYDPLTHRVGTLGIL